MVNINDSGLNLNKQYFIKQYLHKKYLNKQHLNKVTTKQTCC